MSTAVNMSKETAMSKLVAAAGVVLACILTAGGVAAAEDVYNIDPVHSQPIFEVQHMGYSLQRGSFTKMTGKITLDRAAKTGSIDVTIDAASIRTIDPRLDAHVKTDQFFNVEKYPSITFKSDKLIFDGDKVVGAEGSLTLLGITKPVTLKVVNEVCGEHPINKRPMCGAEGTATIKRSDWGMTYGLPRAVGDDVRLILPIEAYKG
jgi:polyisoprenoid-binding protein YceI